MASETATTIPIRKKFLDAKAFVLSAMDTTGAAVASPPRTESARIAMSLSVVRLSLPESSDGLDGCCDVERRGPMEANAEL